MLDTKPNRRSLRRSACSTGSLCLLAFSLAACAERPTVAAASASAPPSETVAAAAEFARKGEVEAALTTLRAALDAESSAAQSALLEPAFALGLRDDERFRAMVGEALLRHRISHLQLAPDGEPGDWVFIEGRTVGQDGAPIAGAEVRVFATDAEGRYHPTLAGETTPRLFGRVVSDSDGRFTLRTVRPGPYPGTRNPRHIHIGARRGDLRLAAPGYAVFDDDPLLFEPGNEEPRGEALRIEMSNTPSGDARGSLVLPMR
jgi:protocatechuate 3,4-dioxygenase beta subunit